MTTFALLVPLATEDDSADRWPGLLILLIMLFLGSAVVFLYFSLRKQLGRIKVPRAGEDTERAEGAEGADDPRDGDGS
jgi:hypothetical protein